MGDIDIVGAQVLGHGDAGVVRADAAHEAGGRSEPCRGHRLVGAFASRVVCHRVAMHRLAEFRIARSADQQVLVDAAHDINLDAHSFDKANGRRLPMSHDSTPKQTVMASPTASRDAASICG